MKEERKFKLLVSSAFLVAFALVFFVEVEFDFFFLESKNTKTKRQSVKDSVSTFEIKFVAS